MATLSSILAWESHEQRRLEGSSPQHCKESDTTEATKHRTHGSTGDRGWWLMVKTHWLQNCFLGEAPLVAYTSAN